MEEQIKELTLLLLYLTSWNEKEIYGEYLRDSRYSVTKNI